jgi:hypothetical protein
LYHELREDGVEACVVERQVLGHSDADVGSGNA